VEAVEQQCTSSLAILLNNIPKATWTSTAKAIAKILRLGLLAAGFVEAGYTLSDLIIR